LTIKVNFEGVRKEVKHIKKLEIDSLFISNASPNIVATRKGYKDEKIGKEG